MDPMGSGPGAVSVSDVAGRGAATRRSILLAVHPALLMVLTWLFVAALFIILPFELVGRPVPVSGFLALGLAIAAFCAGALIVPRGPTVSAPSAPDFALVDTVLTVAAMAAIVVLAIDTWVLNAFNLGEAAVMRGDRAQSLLLGAASQSSIYFKVGFLLYPAGFVIIVREIGFARPLRLVRLLVLGCLPVVLAALALGGRMPILYALVLTVLAVGVRQICVGARRQSAAQRQVRRLILAAGLIGLIAVVVAFSTYIFLVRADQSGGTGRMFDIAESGWGVRFGGWGADLMTALLGEELTYVVFVFAWYLVQGLLVSAQLFSSYTGPMQLGGYGIDLVSALLRRIDGAALAANFDILLSMNVYGFFPSAFGSLFVDLKYLCYVACLGWGFVSGLVYLRARETADPRWLMVLPFTTLGILTSSINTPLGLTNGLVTYGWLALACLLVRAKLPT